MADQELPKADGQAASAPPEPSDTEIVQSLIGTESRGQDVIDLVNRMVGGDEFSNKERGQTL